MNKRILVKPPVREVYLNNKDNEKALSYKKEHLFELRKDGI